MKRLKRSPRSTWNALSYLIGLAAALGAIPARSATYHETVLADHPTAYYRLEEMPGATTASDSSASGAFPGTYVSADGVYPQLGQPGIETNSVYFRSYSDTNGTAQYSYVEIPYAPELNPQGAFSAEAWVRPMSLAADASYRSPFGNFGGWVTDNPGWFFYQTPDTTASPSVWVWVMKGGGVWIQSSTAIAKYDWYHLAAAFDGTNVSFYVNGGLIGSASVPGYVPSTVTSTYIGAGPQGAWLFDGNVDEVAIYSSVLTPDQIQNHYQVGLASFRVENTAPKITLQPLAATAYAGRTVKFSVGADGTAPLAYQWYLGEDSISGATNDSLAFQCAAGDTGASYKVVVTNPYGSATSDVAKLTVSTDLVIVSSPGSITRNVGSAAAFRVATDGALPQLYQWYKGANLIAGATNETLWLSNLQPSDDGSAFHAQVSNAWGNKDTDPATLTVVARAATVPMTGYAKVVMADGPVGYWRLDEPVGSTTAIDAVGSFDGTYDSGTGAFDFAAATGVPNETDKAVGVSGGARVIVPWALELNPHGNWSAEAWLKPSSLAADSQDYRTAFSSLSSGPTGWLVYQQPDNTWSWYIFADNWITSTLGDAQDVIVADSWYHLVLTQEGSTFSLYVNGRLGASLNWDPFIPNRDGAANFGWRSDDDWNPFSGTIDEVAFYNKALTPAQIQAHFQASVSLTLTRSADHVELSWPFGTLQQSDGVSGAYTDLTSASSPFTLTPNASAKFYRVKLP